MNLKSCYQISLLQFLREYWNQRRTVYLNLVLLNITRCNHCNLKHLDDIKSDLNGIFKRCLEAKCKIFDINEKCVKAISSNKNNKLEEGQFFIHINRRENIHGLLQNIVYFKDKNKATINSKVVLQYYINRKKCGDTEQVQYTAPNHGNSGAEKPFLQLRKALCRILRNKSVKKVNE